MDGNEEVDSHPAPRARQLPGEVADQPQRHSAHDGMDDETVVAGKTEGNMTVWKMSESALEVPLQQAVVSVCGIRRGARGGFKSREMCEGVQGLTGSGACSGP